MRKFFWIGLSVATLLVLPSAQARNPGVSAERCVSMQRQGNKGIFKNNCGEKAFIIWCGDLTYSKKRCGDGPKGGYYTHSANIPAGKSHTVSGLKGRVNWGACKGGIGFGHAEYSDTRSGGYVCKKR